METIFYRLNQYWNTHPKEKTIRNHLVRIGLNKAGRIAEDDKNISRHLYGIAIGGFGINRGSIMGNAIFVHFIGKSITETMNLIHLYRCVDSHSERWEAYFRTLEVSELTIDQISKSEGD